MMDEDYIYLTQGCIVRNLSKKEYDVLVDVSYKLNDVRNCAVGMTNLFKSGDNVHYEKINYQSVIGSFKSEFGDEYSMVQAHLANNSIRKHVDSFNSYVAHKNKCIDENKKCKINKPGKHENRLHNIIYTKTIHYFISKEIKRRIH